MFIIWPTISFVWFALFFLFLFYFAFEWSLFVLWFDQFITNFPLGTNEGMNEILLVKYSRPLQCLHWFFNCKYPYSIWMLIPLWCVNVLLLCLGGSGCGLMVCAVFFAHKPFSPQGLRAQLRVSDFWIPVYMKFKSPFILEVLCVFFAQGQCSGRHIHEVTYWKYWVSCWTHTSHNSKPKSLYSPPHTVLCRPLVLWLS